MRTKLTTKQITLIVICITAAALLAGGYLLFSVQRYRFAQDAVYPVDGVAHQIPAKTTVYLKQDEAFAPLKLEGGKEFTGQENAAFFKTGGELVILSSWEFVTAPAGDQVRTYRLPVFTEVCLSGQNVILSRKSSSSITGGSLLFNGKDTYVPLREFALTVGETSVLLPAMSSVTAKYGNWVQYYNSTTGEFGMQELDEGTRAIIDIPEYKTHIEADIDSMQCCGSDYMLLSNLAFLEEYDL